MTTLQSNALTSAFPACCTVLLSIPERSNLDELGPDVVDQSEAGASPFEVRETVRSGLTRIHNEGTPKQTWRVMEYTMLGRAWPPILLTATRIK